MAYTEITDDIERLGPDKGGALSLTAGSDLLAGQLVKLSGDHEAIPSDTDGERVIGVTTQSVSAGDVATVLSLGAQVTLRAGAAITAQDLIGSHGGTGEEGEAGVADATGDFVTGVALEGAGAGDEFTALLTLAGEVN